MYCKQPRTFYLIKKRITATKKNRKVKTTKQKRKEEESK